MTHKKYQKKKKHLKIKRINFFNEENADILKIEKINIERLHELIKHYERELEYIENMHQSELRQAEINSKIKAGEIDYETQCLEMEWEREKKKRKHKSRRNKK